jgi:hypothetical protein
MQFKDLLDVHHIMNQIPNLDEALTTISLPANQVPTEYAHPRVGKKLTIAKCKAINDDKGCDAWWYDAGTYRCLRAYVDKPPSSMAYCTMMLRPITGKHTVLLGRESKMVVVSLSVVGEPDTSTVNSTKDRKALYDYQQLRLLPITAMGEQVDVDSVLNTEFDGKVDCMVAWVKSAAQQTVQFLLHPVLCDSTMFK